MNPYDPNDALSDKSDEYTPDDTLTNIDERTEEFQIDELNMKFRCLVTEIAPKDKEAPSSEEFVSGEVTSDDTNYENVKFYNPFNEIDSGDVSTRTKEESTDVTQTCLDEIKQNLDQTILERKKCQELPEIKSQTSTELIHLLEEAKTLFEPPEKPTTNDEVVEECPMTSSGMELLEIETKLRECHLTKSQNFCKPDARLNKLTLREETSTKPDQTTNDLESSELQQQQSNNARTNFCELLYKSAFITKTSDSAANPIDHKDHQESLKCRPSIQMSENSNKSNKVDEFTVLSRAVQLLESRTSLQSIPNNCRGILGILALQQKLKELGTDKEELERRLYKCNSDFMEFIDILTDKARIISINNKEVANFIKILDMKVPELEKMTASDTESLEDIKYRFKERNVAKIIELRKQIEFYALNIDKLNKRISRINHDNKDTKKQMEDLDIDNSNYKTYFAKKVIEVKANLENLNSLNTELQGQLEQIQNSDLGKNKNFKLKVPALKIEIENISNNIKQVRRDRNNFELENAELRKKLKQLILAKVMEQRNSSVISTS